MPFPSLQKPTQKPHHLPSSLLSSPSAPKKILHPDADESSDYDLWDGEESEDEWTDAQLADDARPGRRRGVSEGTEEEKKGEEMKRKKMGEGILKK